MTETALIKSHQHPSVIARTVFFVSLFFTSSHLSAAWREVAPGVSFQQYPGPTPVVYHVARVNLASDSLKIMATRESERGATTSAYASKQKAYVAINGAYFDPNMTPVGLTVSPCGKWSGAATQTKRKQAFLAVGRGRAEIIPFDAIPTPLPAWIESGLSGWPTLVRDCRALSSTELPGSDAFTRSPHARTAVGISRDARTLYLVVVDGRKSDTAAGVTLPELAEFMKEKLDVCNALNLDGGGSSAMAIQGKVASRPTSGAERVVSNHLAVVPARNFVACPEPSAATVATTAAPPPQMANADFWRDLEEILGRKGTETSAGVFAVTFPRTGPQVIVRDASGQSVALQSELVSSRAVFKRLGAKVVVTGQLYLDADELATALQKLQAAGIGQTGVHRPMLRDAPTLVEVFFAAQGSPSDLAHGIREVLSAAVEGRKSVSRFDTAATLDLGALDRILGGKGVVEGSSVRMTIPRNEKVALGGTEIAVSMGPQSTIFFQPLEDGKVASFGQLALINSEVNGVVRELRRGGFEVTSVHNHFLDDAPRLTFVHFWEIRDQDKLATSLRSAIDRTNHRKTK